MGVKNTKQNQKNQKMKNKNERKKNIIFNYNNNYLITHLHTLEVFRLLILQDGRLSSSLDDGKLIIYNKNNKDADLIICEHGNETLSYHIQLTNGNLVTCSYDATIKIIKLQSKKTYKLLQTLSDHLDKVLKIH